MNTSSGGTGSGDATRGGWTCPRHDAPGEAWRLILADGSSQAAPPRDEGLGNRAGQLSGPPPLPSRHPHRDRDDGLETLADYLQDEDLTLLDLDRISTDLSRWSSPLIPAEVTALATTRGERESECSAARLNPLERVIEAWPLLSRDLQNAILWIAEQGHGRT